MREERFFDSKIHGVLDAFQNAGFHISSPKPAEVFRKRLAYTIGLLENKQKRSLVVAECDELIVTDCAKYLGIINREFSTDKSPLNGFLTACAHGDTRLSLDLFRSFLLSGYTNVEEMLAAGIWHFQLHQVIKPVMISNSVFLRRDVERYPKYISAPIQSPLFAFYQLTSTSQACQKSGRYYSHLYFRIRAKVAFF